MHIVTAVNHGQVAYEAYCRDSDGMSLVSGAKLPHWDDLSAEIQRAWIAAGKAVIDRYVESST